MNIYLIRHGEAEQTSDSKPHEERSLTAEGIEIIFDNEVTSYREILAFFFQIHDPSTPNRQGNDKGASYRSAIYYVSEEQHKIAKQTIIDVDASGLWPGKVVTELEPVGDFWEAEPT